jgi:hypothetical protein
MGGEESEEDEEEVVMRGKRGDYKISLGRGEAEAWGLRCAGCVRGLPVIGRLKRWASIGEVLQVMKSGSTTAPAFMALETRIRSSHMRASATSPLNKYGMIRMQWSKGSSDFRTNRASKPHTRPNTRIVWATRTNLHTVTF